MKKVKVFDIANKVMNVVTQKVPSRLIPFRGNFPLLQPWQEDEYNKAVTSGKNLDEVPDWVQDILLKADNIRRMDEGFEKYLRDNGIYDAWFSYSSSDKATELYRFLNANCMTLEYLQIN